MQPDFERKGQAACDCAMALEFLSRRKPNWQAVLKDVLFKPGNIVEHGEEGEEDEKKI